MVDYKDKVYKRNKQANEQADKQANEQQNKQANRQKERQKQVDKETRTLLPPFLSPPPHLPHNKNKLRKLIVMVKYGILHPHDTPFPHYVLLKRLTLRVK